MKFKMAHGSLFAILLRSPWWISLGIAAAIVAAARTSLPSPYFAFGAMGAFPFVVICCIAGWRQLRAPSPAKLAATLETVAAMSWREFSAAVEAAYVKEGYAVTRLPGPAADFAVQKSGRTTLVSCKRWKAASVGTEALRELAAAQQQQDASASLVISLGNLSDAAQTFAKERGIAVMQAGGLAQLLKDLPVAAKPSAKTSADTRR